MRVRRPERGYRRAAVGRAALLLIAFVLLAPTAQASRLRIVDLRTGAVTAQADARSWSSFVWRPDGTLVATAGRGSVRALPTGTIATIPRALGTSMSPAGDRLATLLPHGGRDERLEIRTVAGDVLGRHRVRGSATSLAWSRDGGQLALGWTDHELDHHLTVLTPRGTVLRTVPVPAQSEFTTAGWAPDGRSLAFLVTDPGLSAQPKPREIRRLDLATGRQSVLLRGTRCGPAGAVGICELLAAPVVSPDGARVAFVRDLNAVTLLGGLGLPAELQPTPHCDGVFDVAWAPDGASMLVAYVQDDTMRLAQVRAGPMGGVPRVVANMGHTSVDGLTVSPDGTRAAFSGTSEIDF